MFLDVHNVYEIDPTLNVDLMYPLSLLAAFVALYNIKLASVGAAIYHVYVLKLASSLETLISVVGNVDPKLVHILFPSFSFGFVGSVGSVVPTYQ